MFHRFLQRSLQHQVLVGDLSHIPAAVCLSHLHLYAVVPVDGQSKKVKIML